MSIDNKIEKYWKGRVLFSWGKYEEMRKLRYDINHYVHGFYPFENCKNKKILEIGCGGGIDSMEYSRNGGNVWATDLTDEAVEFTKGRIERHDFKNIKVEKVSVKDIPYEDNFFDVVHVFGILHHITDVDVGVKEILRVLKPGGSVYAMFYNKNSLLYYHSIMYLRGVVNGEFERGLTEEDLVSKYSEAETGCPYTKIYTEDSVEKLFYDNGFGKVETQIDSPHIDTLEERKVEIKNLPRNLGWHISTKATK